MVKNTILFLILISISFSCQKKSDIDKAKMTEIILKIHECEAYNELKFNNQNQDFFNNCKSQVLKDAKVSTKDYENSMEYFQKNPAELEEIYDTILLKHK